MILAPPRNIISAWDWLAAFTAGKRQRNPNGKRNRSPSSGKQKRNTAENMTCCCVSAGSGEVVPCTFCTGSTPASYTATIDIDIECVFCDGFGVDRHYKTNPNINGTWELLPHHHDEEDPTVAIPCLFTYPQNFWEVGFRLRQYSNVDTACSGLFSDNYTFAIIFEISNGTVRRLQIGTDSEPIFADEITVSTGDCEGPFTFDDNQSSVGDCFPGSVVVTAN